MSSNDQAGASFDRPPFVYEIRVKGRLQPGKMFLIDTRQGRIVSDDEIKDELAAQHPYGEWLAAGMVDLRDLPEREHVVFSHDSVLRRQQMFGYTHEELKVIVAPMARAGSEPIPWLAALLCCSACDLATHDALTDLPTLLLARDRLGMAISLARRNKTAVAVMFLDLDGFKAINESLGHEAGDYILIRTGQRLLACVRESDTVARVGGDEFLIIASGIHDLGNAEKIVERVHALISQPILFKRNRTIVGGASIGISLYPDDGAEMEALIKRAEEAMHTAKKSGRKPFRIADSSVSA